MIPLQRFAAVTHSGAQPYQRVPDMGTASANEREQILSGLLATPEFFPVEIDFSRNAISFVRMSRQSFRQLSFLDNRFVRAGPDSFFVELMDLLPKCSAAQAKHPLHFVLHGAFCGSTLMARHLEELPNCFVLKEPGLLAQLARLKHGPPGPVASAADSWADWFTVAMALFARAYSPDAAVIIKPNDVCNWMGDSLLDHDGRTRIIFLSSPLRMFLLSVLKAEDRRSWARGRIRQLKGFLVQVPFLAEIAVEGLSDGQCGAALWLLNSFLCSSLQEGPRSDRIHALNSEDLIRRPQQVLHDAADFFGLTGDEANRAALRALRPLSYHAKHVRLPYDAAARAIDHDNLERHFGQEAGVAMAWAVQVSSGWLSRSPFPVE